jgi:hypothetical protein
MDINLLKKILSKLTHSLLVRLGNTFNEKYDCVFLLLLTHHLICVLCPAKDQNTFTQWVYPPDGGCTLLIHYHLIHVATLLYLPYGGCTLLIPVHHHLTHVATLVIPT